MLWAAAVLPPRIGPSSLSFAVRSVAAFLGTERWGPRKIETAQRRTPPAHLGNSHQECGQHVCRQAHPMQRDLDWMDGHAR
jgi:hypothetical protein